jgi:hypothetical protein
MRARFTYSLVAAALLLLHAVLSVQAQAPTGLLSNGNDHQPVNFYWHRLQRQRNTPFEFDVTSGVRS